jgi:hypothetical protein
MSNEWFKNGEIIITEDNIHASKNRMRAIEAMRSGTATAEQAQLVMDADRAMQEAMEQRKK